MIGHKKHKRLKKEGEGELAFAKGTEEEGALGRANQELGIGMEKGTEAQRHKGTKGEAPSGARTGRPVPFKSSIILP